MNYSSVETTAKNYYDSDDADKFYSLIWGGEDIHIGLYNSAADTIYDASRRTIEKMISLIHELPEGADIIDLGSGYGGSARFLARAKKCRIVCLNISEVENQKNKKRNQEEWLSQQIDVREGSFESIPFEKESFDLVWSQDAILHSGNKEKVFEEISRVLKKNGIFIFTDPMQKKGVSSSEIKPVLERIHLDSLGSFEYYKITAEKFGLKQIETLDMSEQLVNHYSHVLCEIENRHEEIKNDISAEYLNRMKTGLVHWIESGKKGLLSWGIMKFRKDA